MARAAARIYEWTIFCRWHGTDEFAWLARQNRLADVFYKVGTPSSLPFHLSLSLSDFSLARFCLLLPLCVPPLSVVFFFFRFSPFAFGQFGVSRLLLQVFLSFCDTTGHLREMEKGSLVGCNKVRLSIGLAAIGTWILHYFSTPVWASVYAWRNVSGS